MKPFMSKRRREAIKAEHAQNAAARRRGTSSGTYNPATDPANPGAVYYQHQTNDFYPDGSYTSRTEPDYGGSRDTGPSSSSSYDSGSSGGGSYDSGSSGGSYGGE